mmetsp:Transcript_59070/g.156875  ORF Transcript_59070/g.156875 Transcript_59070/m.156875 type:complete len:247 (+) Transcript_59070:341-1081(+)
MMDGEGRGRGAGGGGGGLVVGRGVGGGGAGGRGVPAGVEGLLVVVVVGDDVLARERGGGAFRLLLAAAAGAGLAANEGELRVGRKARQVSVLVPLEVGAGGRFLDLRAYFVFEVDPLLRGSLIKVEDLVGLPGAATRAQEGQALVSGNQLGEARRLLAPRPTAPNVSHRLLRHAVFARDGDGRNPVPRVTVGPVLRDVDGVDLERLLGRQPPALGERRLVLRLLSLRDQGQRGHGSGALLAHGESS